MLWPARFGNWVANKNGGPSRGNCRGRWGLLRLKGWVGRPEQRLIRGIATCSRLESAGRNLIFGGMRVAYELCLATAAKQVPSGPDWIHEVKHDGYRMLVILNDH